MSANPPKILVVGGMQFRGPRQNKVGAQSRGLLFSEDTVEGRMVQAKAIGAQAIFPRKTWVSSRGVAAAHKAGLAAVTWT